jgi:hypothetical protein
MLVLAFVLSFVSICFCSCFRQLSENDVMPQDVRAVFDVLCVIFHTFYIWRKQKHPYRFRVGLGRGLDGLVIGIVNGNFIDRSISSKL